MIALFDDLEIKGIMINGIGFTKAVYAWNKVTINYSLSIWAQKVNYFPAFDYIIYNNSLNGGGEQKWNKNFDIKEINRLWNRDINSLELLKEKYEEYKQNLEP
jgi:hypothetical protein